MLELGLLKSFPSQQHIRITKPRNRWEYSTSTENRTTSEAGSESTATENCVLGSVIPFPVKDHTPESLLEIVRNPNEPPSNFLDFQYQS